MKSKSDSISSAVSMFLLLGVVFIIGFSANSKEDDNSDYEPNKNNLYPLYLSGLEDTVVNDEDTTILVLRVEVVNSWKPDSVDHKKINWKH